MSRSSNSQKIVLDDRVEIFLGFTEPGDVIKDNLGFFERLCSVRNAYLDGVDDRERRISVVDYFYSIIYTRHHNSRHICAVIAVHGFRAAAPDKQSALDGHVVQHDFAVRCAAADDEVAVHGHVLERHFVGANQDAALDVFVVGSLGHNVSADDVMENLRKFCAGDIIQRFQPFGSAVDIIRADHCPDIGQRPTGNVLFICKFGQVRFGICVVVQFQRTGNNRHGFLPRDRRIWGHC